MNKPSQQQTIEAYKRLPPQIQEFLADSEKLPAVLMSIKSSHQLHADVAGKVGESVGYLLLGFMRPEEFIQELVSANISDTDARQITAEINQKIFVPLRAQMQQSAVPQRTAQLQPRVNAPVPSYAPPRPPAPAAPTSVRPAFAAPTQSPVAANPNPARIPTPHEVHSPSLGEVIKAVGHPANFTPSQRSYTPPNLPGAMPPPAPRPFTPEPAPPVPLTPKPPAQPYSTDPYHEPIDGNI